jgi:predicted RNA-binding protein YlxR (DUF448 family)
MKNKKIPIRSCVVSHERLPKKEMIRVVRTPENIIIIDCFGKANGRGAYLKRDIEIIEKAKKNKILDKHLECVVPDNIFEDLKELIK